MNKIFPAVAIVALAATSCTKTASDVCKEASQSVVKINVLTPFGMASGSGVVVAEDTIVTNAHVASMSLVMVVEKDGRELLIDPNNIVMCGDSDLAIVKVPKLAMKPIKLATKDPKQGEVVYTLGHPLGFPLFFAQGVFNYRMPLGDMVFSLFTAQISPRNSGGALLNSKGELIGITTASAVRGQNLNLAVPTDKVIGFMKLNGIGVKRAK